MFDINFSMCRKLKMCDINDNYVTPTLPDVTQWMRRRSFRCMWLSESGDVVHLQPEHGQVYRPEVDPWHPQSLVRRHTFSWNSPKAFLITF